MIPKKYFKFIFSLVFLVVSVLILFPADSNAQPLGCCTNSGNSQCRTNTPCGPGAGETCQVTQNTCFNAPANEGGNPANNWIAGETCLITGMQRQCGNDGQTPCCYSNTLGCCELSDGTLVEETELQCAIDGGTFLNEGSCEQPPLGCCVTNTNPFTCFDDQTSGECSGDFEVGGTCAGSCAPAPPIDGCCQRQDTICEDTTNTDCLDSPFFPGGMCMGGEISFCNPPPTGCCVIEQGECEVITENSCDDLGGDYQGDGSDCVGNPLCEEPIVINSVPTLSQWGLIAMAGMLGIFSLIILMRRHKYNLS